MWVTTRLTILLALAVLLFVPSHVRAFEFSPQVIDLSTEGLRSSVEISYTVTNSASMPATYLAKLVSLTFGASNELSSINPVDEGYEETFELGSGETAKMHFTTLLSESYEGYGIQITESLSGSEPALSVRPNVLIPIFIVDEQASNLDIAQVQMHSNGWRGVSTITVSYHNQGQATAQPADAIVIKSLLGSVVEAIPVNPMLYRIVGGSQRDLSVTWEHGLFRIGIYCIELSTVRGTTSESVALKHVIILPWKLLAPMFVLVLATYLLHARFIRKTND